jgi:hypothetical protein
VLYLVEQPPYCDLLRLSPRLAVLPVGRRTGARRRHSFTLVLVHSRHFFFFSPVQLMYWGIFDFSSHMHFLDDPLMIDTSLLPTNDHHFNHSQSVRSDPVTPHTTHRLDCVPSHGTSNDPFNVGMWTQSQLCTSTQ